MMKFSKVVVKYHKIVLVGTRKKFLQSIFSGGRKKLKNGHFSPPLHKSKLIFHAYEVDIQNFYQFTILNSSKLQ